MENLAKEKQNVQIEMDTDSTPFTPENNLFHTDSKQLENQRVISIIGVIDIDNASAIVLEMIIMPDKCHCNR